MCVLSYTFSNYEAVLIVTVLIIKTKGHNNGCVQQRKQADFLKRGTPRKCSGGGQSEGGGLYTLYRGIYKTVFVYAALSRLIEAYRDSYLQVH